MWRWADTVALCEEAYVQLLASNGISSGTDTGTAGEKYPAGSTRIAQSVIDGNSHFYLVLEGSDLIFDVPVQEYLKVVALTEGDQVTIEYLEGDPVCTVTGTGIDGPAEKQ